MTLNLHKSASTIAILAAITAFAWSATRLGWLAVTPQAEVAPARSQTLSPVRTGGTSNTADLAGRIGRAHLFGSPPKDKPLPDRRVEPATRLNLTLSGVFATGNGEGRALIGNGNAQARVYKVGGERLPGGARLVEIRSDSVLIEVDSRRERLDLRHLGNGGKIYLDGRASVNPQGPARPSSTAGASQSLAALRDEVIRNPARLAGMASMKRILRDGDQLGYRLAPKTEGRALFQALGLRAGDIITSINGIALESQASALDSLQALSTASVLELGLLRRGAPMNLSHTIP